MSDAHSGVTGKLSPVQAPGQGKPSNSGRARKRNIEDFEDEDLYQPTNSRKRHRVSWPHAPRPSPCFGCARDVPEQMLHELSCPCALSGALRHARKAL